METLGWIGAILLGACGVPELLKTLKTKKCTLSSGFLLMWGVGEILTLIPVIGQNLGAFLVFNYTLNIIIISVLCYYKFGTTAD